jgi:large subunit ribosomal protein L10
MPNAEKVAEVAALEDKLRRAASVVLTEFTELSVAQATKIRRELRPRGLEFRVVKNTLLRLAASRAGVEGLEPYLVGTTAAIFAYDDPVAAAKAATEFTRQFTRELKVKAGVLEGQVVDAATVRALSALPSRDELLAKIAGSLAAPLQNLASLFQAPLRNLAFGLSQLAAQREAS